MNLIIHDKTKKEKITKLEIQISELKNSLNDCEQDKIFISDINLKMKDCYVRLME